MDPNNKELEIRCECGTELIKFEYDIEWQEWFVFFFVYRGQGTLSWKQRFKYAWKLLRHGKVKTNEIVIRPEAFKDFVEEANVKLKEIGEEARRSAEEGNRSFIKGVAEETEKED